MKILILNHEYPPIGGGGAQACRYLAEELVSRGHEITILTAWYTGLPREESSRGLTILRLPTLRRSPFRAGFFTMAMYIAACTLRGLAVTRKWKPHLVHAHFAVPAGVSAWLLHRLTGIPYVLTAHLGDVPGGVPEKTDRWFRLVYPLTIPVWKRASAAVTVSGHTSSLVQKHYPVTPHIIHNGIPIGNRDAPGSLHKPPGILFAGRFVPQKNLAVFLEVLNSIRDLDWNCVMIGDGQDFQSIRNQAEAYRLLNRIKFPGWVDQAAVQGSLEASDILFMPSLSEGLPVVGVEALGAGLAILASDIGGFRDLVVNDVNGYLVGLPGSEQFKTRIRHLLENPDALLHARQQSKKMAEKFNIQATTDQYELIFKAVAGMAK